MMGEIAHLESILGDIVKQLNNSETLPPVGEDLVNNFHFPDGPSSWDDMVSVITVTKNDLVHL